MSKEKKENQDPQPYPTYLTCSCCGRGVPDTAEGNTAFGVEPYPFDEGIGMCVECGGDSTTQEIEPTDDEKTAEAKARKKIGKGMCMFFDARINMLLGIGEYARLSGNLALLNNKNRANFAALPFATKCLVITRLVKKGVII